LEKLNEMAGFEPTEQYLFICQKWMESSSSAQ
jgi:hypothetical protein